MGLLSRVPPLILWKSKLFSGFVYTDTYGGNERSKFKNCKPADGWSGLHYEVEGDKLIPLKDPTAGVADAKKAAASKPTNGGKTDKGAVGKGKKAADDEEINLDD